VAGALVAAVGQSEPAPIEWYRLEVEKLHARYLELAQQAQT